MFGIIRRLFGREPVVGAALVRLVVYLLAVWFGIELSPEEVRDALGQVAGVAGGIVVIVELVAAWLTRRNTSPAEPQ